MKIKKGLFLVLTLVLLSGCTAPKVRRVDNINFLTRTKTVLSLNIKHYNEIGKGYKYYAPRGVVRTYENANNDILKKNNNYYYLYVDVISYYYQKPYSYKLNKKAYTSEILNRNGTKGYLEINKSKDKYYVQMFYNYAKIETYVSKTDLSDTLSDLSYILSSVKFNDLLLKKMYLSGDLQASDEAYYLFSNKTKQGNFLEYIKEYDKYDASKNKSQTDESAIEVKTTTTTVKTTNQTTTK